MTDLKIQPDDIKSFEGKSLVITGASSGIGLSIARIARDKGANVLISDLRPPEDPSHGFAFHAADVTKWSDLIALFKEAKERFGTIDMVCPNAGIAKVPETTFSDTFDDRGELLEPTYPIIQVNLIAVLNTVKLAMHYMKKQESGGSIVVTASMSGYSAMGLPIYAASKHGVIGMMRGLRNWVEPHKIRLNCVSPGITATPINPDGAREKLASVGVVSQSSDYPALAALYLHQSTMNGKSIFSSEKKYRELESGVQAASEIIYGDAQSGRKYATNPEQLALVKTTIMTVI